MVHGTGVSGKWLFQLGAAVATILDGLTWKIRQGSCSTGIGTGPLLRHMKEAESCRDSQLPASAVRRTLHLQQPCWWKMLHLTVDTLQQRPYGAGLEQNCAV